MSDLAGRIEAAYQNQTGAASPRGARAWFARLTHSLPGTVSRWLAAGELPGPALGVLELMEGAHPHRGDGTMDGISPERALDFLITDERRDELVRLAEQKADEAARYGEWLDSREVSVAEIVDKLIVPQILPKGRVRERRHLAAMRREATAIAVDAFVAAMVSRREYAMRRRAEYMEDMKSLSDDG